MPLLVPIMRSVWESPVLAKFLDGRTDYNVEEKYIKVTPSLGNSKPNCCIESTLLHQNEPFLLYWFLGWTLGLSLSARWRRLGSGYELAPGNWVNPSCTRGKSATRSTILNHSLWLWKLGRAVLARGMWSRYMPISMTVKLMAAECMCFHLPTWKKPQWQWDSEKQQVIEAVAHCFMDEWSSGVVHCFTVPFEVPLATEAGWFSVSLPPNLCFQQGSLDLREDKKRFCCNVRDASDNFVCCSANWDVLCHVSMFCTCSVCGVFFNF